MTTEPIPILDDVVRMQAVDKRNMLRLINELPEQCETALGVARSTALEPFVNAPSDVFITGVGDSAIAADMASAILSEQADIPILSDCGGRLPKHVGEKSLVFVLDYAGKSRSALRNMRDARQRGASVICISGGGKLLEQAAKEGIARVSIPPGQPQRSAIGYLLVPVIVTIERLGLVEGETEKVSHAIKLMKNARESLRFENVTARNVAKRLAQSLFGKLVVVYGAYGYRTAVARRWKSQINSNSKALAFYGALQDLATGEISGYELAAKRANEVAIVLLRDKADKPAISHLSDAVSEVLNQFGVVNANIQGNSTTEKLFYGLYLGDYVSYYLAILNETDPFSTENVLEVEARMVDDAQPATTPGVMDDQAEE